MNTARPSWASAYHSHKKPLVNRSVLWSSIAILLLVTVLTLVFRVGSLAWNAMKLPELQINNHDAVVRVYEADGKEYTPATDPLFTQRVNRILKDGRYERTFVGPDKK